MSVTEELYQAGSRLYRQQSFVAAEEIFGQLCNALPDAGQEAGRAHYSLALCFIEQRRLGEARQALNSALRADPQLQRALDRLREIDAAQLAANSSPIVDAPIAHPPAARPTRPPGPVRGTATKVRRSTQGSPWIARATNTELSFRLIVASGSIAASAVAVSMRGPRIVGSLEEGDQIELPDHWRPGREPSCVSNLTTGEDVYAAKAGRVLQWMILVIFLVAFAAFAIWVFSNMASDPPGFGGPDR